MKRLYLTAMTVSACLTACQGELPERAAAQLEPFAPPPEAEFDCVFSEVSEASEEKLPVLVTLETDGVERAEASYGGERLSLYAADGESGDGVKEFAIAEYPGFDVRLETTEVGAGTMPGTRVLSGRVELRTYEAGEARVVSAVDVAGTCRG